MTSKAWGVGGLLPRPRPRDEWLERDRDLLFFFLVECLALPRRLSLLLLLLWPRLCLLWLLVWGLLLLLLFLLRPGGDSLVDLLEEEG